ncbi:MAG: aminopeptidase P family protein [Candidatus Aminicenantes bacterium]|nr:MAG: aminopeptidase P family protein [Candidatus Aminicenantes bacterium]RLE05069.1 MAG: aminopeptidase P family protein [Candidatus Aminicenantes bacterium]
MKWSRRSFLRNLSLGFFGAGLTKSSFPSVSPPLKKENIKGDSAKLLVKDPDHPQPAPKGVDRLPLSWYKKTVKRLKERVGERGVDVIVIEDSWNMTYFSGCFLTKTERPCWCVFPVAEEDVIYWFSPGLDNELVKSWWCTEMNYYYDYPHAKGGYPDKGKVVKGHRVDLFEWFLEGMKKKGYADKTFGFDSEFTPSRMKKFKKVLPKAKVVDISDICLKMRMVKTPEEIALIQRAMNYFSQIHAFGRDYLLTRGTDATDFEVAKACEEYGTNLIMQDIKRDGRPHNAVGIRVRIGCRTGRGTAYPHPNQFHHNKIKKGDALQIAGIVTIGGYGGELYRYFQLYPWDDWREKVWEVVTEAVRIQERESKAGVTCAEVAYKVHKFQVEQGKDIQRLLYQRVAHGQGMEGHQPPFIALGDETVLEEGMTFSVEPGLFDPLNGFGYNPSDCLLVTRKKGVLMGSVPYSKEWMFLKL